MSLQEMLHEEVPPLPEYFTLKFENNSDRRQKISVIKEKPIEGPGKSIIQISCTEYDIAEGDTMDIKNLSLKTHVSHRFRFRDDEKKRTVSIE